jgi:hypothetical protein
MGLTRPIPKAAMPVVRILRRDVPRPKKIAFRWSVRCPLGLHPKAISLTPVDRVGFPPCQSNWAITAFYLWWDDQTDAKAAVNAMWPQKKRKAQK